jgi:hypothetical protein
VQAEAEAEAAAEAVPAASPPAEPQRAAVQSPGTAMVRFDPESHTPCGPGSLAPRIDGAAPTGYPVKGNVDTMLFHTEASRWFHRIKADVWFDSEDRARAAGFTRWDQRVTSSLSLRD